MVQHLTINLEHPQVQEFLKLAEAKIKSPDDYVASANDLNLYLYEKSHDWAFLEDYVGKRTLDEVVERGGTCPSLPILFVLLMQLNIPEANPRLINASVYRNAALE